MKSKPKIFCVVGTRPEFIKMFPVYQELKKRSESIDLSWVESGQHKELTQDLYKIYELKPDYSFDLKLKENISDAEHLVDLASQVLESASKLFAKKKPDLVLVQGDTMTVQQVALAAFYHKIQVAHVEAGLRTSDISSPFPEELSRRIVDQISTLHFAPTQNALENLHKENLNHASVTGNTGIDMLQNTLANDLNLEGEVNDLLLSLQNKKLILLTIHRRENLDYIESFLQSISEFANARKDIAFVVSLHKNPHFESKFKETSTQSESINLIEAPSYPSFVKLMQASHLIITDSGGIQEEAPYLAKPVLVFRKETERQEGIDQGCAKYINEESVQEALSELIDNEEAYQAMASGSAAKLYGDGSAAAKIADSCIEFLLIANQTTKK